MTRRARKQGVTIIEVVMAIVILSIALPPMIVAFAEAAVQSIQPADMTVASFLAIDRMEEVIARRFRDTEGYEELTVPTIAGFPDEDPVSGFPRFRRTVRVAYVDRELSPAAADEGYKKVVVTVAWDAESLEIERVFADFQP
ncbi:MAG: hypothetical protein DCC65_01510 [Planctomycetota bacterium]|nr:MAG: hypothetical protein DCC65_01510 [Planctomycetota bacterium]